MCQGKCDLRSVKGKQTYNIPSGIYLFDRGNETYGLFNFNMWYQFITRIHIRRGSCIRRMLNMNFQRLCATCFNIASPSWLRYHTLLIQKIRLEIMTGGGGFYIWTSTKISPFFCRGGGHPVFASQC